MPPVNFYFEDGADGYFEFDRSFLPVIPRIGDKIKFFLDENTDPIQTGIVSSLQFNLRGSSYLEGNGVTIILKELDDKFGKSNPGYSDSQVYTEEFNSDYQFSGINPDMIRIVFYIQGQYDKPLSAVIDTQPPRAGDFVQFTVSLDGKVHTGRVAGVTWLIGENEYATDVAVGIIEEAVNWISL